MINRTQKGYLRSAFYILIVAFICTYFATNVIAQEPDTVSNWDGIDPGWSVWSGSAEVVYNPYQNGINTSARCMKLTTTTGLYDLMWLQLSEAVDFNTFPIYTLKCYPPAGGGDVVLKFENNDNTQSQEILMPVQPGKWNELKFNFSGLEANNLTRMVVFFDFEGTTSGQNWYFDDIIKHPLAPLALQSNLPIVVINTNGVSIPDEPKINAQMGIIDNGPGEINNINDPFNNYDGAIGIETRGQSTQMFPKKSYGFETRDSLGENQDVSLLGMPEENDWILYAPYTDKSLMRNVVTFDMGHHMGNYCTRTQYCEVVINNDYKGIYVLEEKIKKNKNRVDISTLKPDEITGDDLTGGYILSVDKIPSGFSYALDGWKSSPSPSYPNAMPIIFQYYYPKPEDIVNEQRTYIKNYVTTTEKALIASSFKDPSTGYLKYFDAPSFVDFMLLNEISKEVDKYRYSTYLYKQKDSDGGRLFAGPVWDFNLGYGNVDYWAPGVDYSGWVYEMVEPHEYSIMFWWKRLMEDPYFKNLTFTRWTELRQDVLKTDNIVAVIDSIRLYTENARLRNFERWPILGQYVWPNYNWYGNDYADEVAYFQNFLTHRLTWMDGHITGTFLKPAAGISSESNTIRLILYGDYFSHEHLKTTHFQLNDAPANVYIQSADYVSPYECTLTLSADVSTFKEISVTVKNEIVNTYHDIVSNKLATAGISQVVADLPDLRVYSSSDGIHIESLQLSLTPAEVMVRSVSGSLSGKYTIKLQNQNILPSPPASGIYIVTILQSGVVRNYKIVVV